MFFYTYFEEIYNFSVVVSEQHFSKSIQPHCKCSFLFFPPLFFPQDEVSSSLQEKEGAESTEKSQEKHNRVKIFLNSKLNYHTPTFPLVNFLSKLLKLEQFIGRVYVYSRIQSIQKCFDSIVNRRRQKLMKRKKNPNRWKLKLHQTHLILSAFLQKES